MFRALLRLVVVIVIVVGAAAFFLGWWGGGHWPGARTAEPTPAVGTSGHVDTEKAREVGAKVGEKTAVAASRAQEVLSDGALTAKIKSKMALDDLVRARTIDVSTTDSVVTLSGNVRSAAEHDRAMQLAKETTGVTRVVDRLAGGR